MQNNPSTESERPSTSWQILKIVANFICKYYILCLLFVYVIGTFIYITNNMATGFPFTALSVVQYAVLVFYVVIISVLPVIINVIQFELYKKQPKAPIITKFKIFFHSVGWEYYAVSLSTCALLYSITGNLPYILLFVMLTCILAPIFGFFRGLISLGLRFIVYVIAIWMLILDIPVSAGGLKPLPVEFCAFESEQCQTYTFFGEANGLYHFRDGDTVILQPTDSGYLRYDKNAVH